jgi:L-arabinose isomerase
MNTVLETSTLRSRRIGAELVKVAVTMIQLGSTRTKVMRRVSKSRRTGVQVIWMHSTTQPEKTACAPLGSLPSH